MNIIGEIEKAHSKEITVSICTYIGDDPMRFREAFNVFLNGTALQKQRIAWVIGDVLESHPDLLKPHIKPFIDNMMIEGQHPAIYRNTVRVLQNYPIPEDYWGIIVDRCFQFINSKETPVAIQVFSMTILLNIIKYVPELKLELQESLESQIPYQTAGFINRAQKTLKALEKVS